MDSLLVPSSMQRIRSFLVEMCGMKVKPWASTEETLAALHTTLVARQACGVFWDSLRTLLERLARDMKARASALPGTVIDNEVLDGERYTRLLDEIRQALDRQDAATTGTFRQLSAAISGPALSLLLLLGGVASVGCDRSSLRQPNNKPDASLAAAAKPDTGPDSVEGPPPPGPGQDDGGNTVVRKLDAPVTTPPDGSVRITLPDAAPDHDAATRGADGGVVTIQDIMDSCNVPEELQLQVRACLMALDASWTTGMAESLAGDRCNDVSSQLNCFATYSMTCPPLGNTGEFVVGQTRICQPIYIYAGVRFV